MPKFTIKAQGVREVLEKLGSEGARELVKDLDKVTERNARKMANESARKAPVKTGKLASSIPKTVKRESPMTWEFGSDLEYAQRQEYEHASKKAFFRRSLWEGREPFREDIRKTISKLDD